MNFYSVFLCHLKVKTNNIRHNEKFGKKYIYNDTPYSYTNEDYNMIPTVRGSIGYCYMVKN